MSHIVIIGGGVAGLYAAYKLIQKSSNYNITLLEASDRIGGRVYTIRNKSLIYEGGAARFSNSHKNLTKLIKELNLEHTLYPMSTNKLFIKDSKPLSNFSEEVCIKRLETEALKRPKNELVGKPMIMFMREVLPPSEVDDLIYAFGYESEFHVCNAHYGMKSLKKDFMTKVQHYGMKGGLKNVIDKLLAHLEKNGVHVLTNWVVEDIDPTQMKITGQFNKKQTELQADKFIICVTKDRLMQFRSLINYDKHLQTFLAHLHSQPLYRIYAKFPATQEKPAWFKDLPRICTNNALRHIIPINPAIGLIMISYTDGNWAQVWKQFSSKKILKKELMTHLRLLMPEKQIPDPEWIDYKYWDHAAHYPGPNFKTYVQLNAKKYVLCGEMMVAHPWIEGSLMSVENISKLLFV